MLGKSRQVYRQLGHDGKPLHANLSNRNQVRTPSASTVWGITIINKRKMNVYNCKYHCCYDCYLRLYDCDWHQQYNKLKKN